MEAAVKAAMASSGSGSGGSDGSGGDGGAAGGGSGGGDGGDADERKEEEVAMLDAADLQALHTAADAAVNNLMMVTAGEPLLRYPCFSPSSDRRGPGLPSRSRGDAVSELNSLSDEEMADRLVSMTEDTQVLHARVALLHLFAAWPLEACGPLRLGMLGGAPPPQPASRGADALQLKLGGGAGVSRLLEFISYTSFRASSIESLLPRTPAVRISLELLTEVMRAALAEDDELAAAMLGYCRCELRLAASLRYGEVDWSLGAEGLLSVTGGVWTDDDALQEPNMTAVRWLTPLLCELPRHRPLVFCAWAVALCSPSLLLKQYAATTLSQMLLVALQADDVSALQAYLRHLPSAETLSELTVLRLGKEQAQAPLLSVFLQALVELNSCSLLARRAVAAAVDGRAADGAAAGAGADGEAAAEASAEAEKEEEAASWAEEREDWSTVSDEEGTLYSGLFVQHAVDVPDPPSDPDMPKMEPGRRVRRGPDWKWAEQDGGAGKLGRVEEITSWGGVHGEGVSVRWDNGNYFNYRWGAEECYDLTMVEALDDGTVLREFPPPEAGAHDRFGPAMRMGCLLRLRDSARREDAVVGEMEWPDYNATVRVEGHWEPDRSALHLREVSLRRFGRNEAWTKAVSWKSRFGDELWQPGTTYRLVPDGRNLLGRARWQAVVDGIAYDVSANLSLRSDVLFVFDADSHGHNIDITPDQMTAIATGADAPGTALGSVGFTRGVHYWEVQVRTSDLGTVFVGIVDKMRPGAVDPARLNRWFGWGFVNFRATLQSGRDERIYGEFFNDGDVVGVRLDMERGILSFFLDGVKYGEHLLSDLGFAFSGLATLRKALYPMVALKRGGNRVTLLPKYISRPAAGPARTLRMAADVTSSLLHWGSQPQPQRLMRLAWAEWRRWRRGGFATYASRASRIAVTLDVRPASFAALGLPFAAGDKVAARYSAGRPLEDAEEAVVLGLYRGLVWYRTDGSETGAWHWLPSEVGALEVLSRKGSVARKAAADAAAAAGGSGDADELAAEAAAGEDFASWLELLAPASWTASMDAALVMHVNHACAVSGVEPANLPFSALQPPTSGPLAACPASRLRARAALLTVFNRRASHVLPLLSLSLPDKWNRELVYTRGSDADDKWSAPRVGRLLRGHRGLFYTAVKRAFWDDVLDVTTTETALPQDEYDEPKDIRVIRINRVKASVGRLAQLNSWTQRLSESVFGQLASALSVWTDADFRRAYVGKGHGGQRRAFKVAFVGEGVEDYGGPYRATFEQVVDELQTDNVPIEGARSLLPLLIPTPNRFDSVGSGRDKFMFNPSMTTRGAVHMFRMLGVIVGIAVRHGLQLGLSLPTLVWRSLAMLPVSRLHLEAVDSSFVRSMESLERLHEAMDEATLEDEEAFTDMVGEYFFEVTLSNGRAVPLCAGGEKRAVTGASLLEFVRASISARLGESRRQLRYFMKGLAAVLPAELFSLFSCHELEQLLCGRPEVDVALLQAVTEYEGVDDSAPHIVWFWQVMQEMTSEQRTAFLRFVWARSRMPTSIKDFPMNFKIQPAHSEGARLQPDAFLPHAATCFFSLSLPAYSSKDILRDKLLYAISNSPTMDADVRLHDGEGWAGL
eukprot:PLAT12551.17.p1 GENE.PLAT12551.17~~PLAT12551.17.p1  ORF type:complete len:1683 (-),score=962.86 PLAT12551.17:102-4913(-)